MCIGNMICLGREPQDYLSGRDSEDKKDPPHITSRCEFLGEKVYSRRISFLHDKYIGNYCKSKEPCEYYRGGICKLLIDNK